MAGKGNKSYDFGTVSCKHADNFNFHPGLTSPELMRVEKREFAREFSQLSCAGQTR